MGDLDGKVTLITGGCGDLGRAIARRFVQAGASVWVNDILSPDRATRALHEAGLSEDRVRYYCADVTDWAAVRDMVEAIIGDRGHLDAVICNAGIVESAPVLDVTPETWYRHLDVNLTGVFFTAQAAARTMVAHGLEGRIVLTGSWVGEVPWLEIAPYSVSKAGVRMLGRAMAKELAPHGIRVNVMEPGIVRAGMARRQWDTDANYRARASKAIPLRDAQSPESVAEAMLWLCSPASEYMTGAVLLVDGGASLFAQD